MSGGWLVLGLLLGATDGPLGLADLPGYAAALSERPDQPAATVGFRALWDRPDAYRGRLVRVEGRVVRRFRQPAVGAFPPLTELWVVTSEEDPICLVFPTGGDGPDLGARVGFNGRFLRLVRYPGGDAGRIAPLIVGGGIPAVIAGPDVPTTGNADWTRLDWMVGLVAGVVVVVVIARTLARRPRRRAEHPGPPPAFLED